jgi:hypothetical protein
MATGDQVDMSARIQRAIPQNWFPSPSSAVPILSALLAGLGYGLAWTYSQVQYALLQTRIATATGAWLDLIAQDFFGTTIARSSAVTDTAFRATIEANLLQPVGTRPGLINALKLITGNTATITDLWNPNDVGARNVGTLAYGVSGCYGSLLCNTQTFVTIAPGTASNAQIYATAAASIEAGGTAWVDIT